MDRPSSANATWACGYVVAARARALCAPSHWALASSGLEQWNHAKASASDTGRFSTQARERSASRQHPVQLAERVRLCGSRRRRSVARNHPACTAAGEDRTRQFVHVRNAACPPRNPAPSSCGPPRGNAGLSARSPKQGPLRFPFLDRENVSTRSVLHLRICPACVSRTLDGDEFPNKSRVLTEPSARLTRPPERTSVLL